MEKYLAAAETILNEALALGPEPKTETIRWTAATNAHLRGDMTQELAAKGILDKVRADIVPNNGALDARDLKIATTGEYRVRVKLSGLRPEGGRAAGCACMPPTSAGRCWNRTSMHPRTIR